MEKNKVLILIDYSYRIARVRDTDDQGISSAIVWDNRILNMMHSSLSTFTSSLLTAFGWLVQKLHSEKKWSQKVFCNRLASFCNRLSVKKTNHPNAVNSLKVNVDSVVYSCPQFCEFTRLRAADLGLSQLNSLDDVLFLKPSIRVYPSDNTSIDNL